MKYSGSITILDNEGNSVYERELTAEEMIETLLAKKAEPAPAEDPRQDPELFPTRKNKATKYHGKTAASESRRKGWNSDEDGAKKNGSMTGKVKDLFDAGKDDDEISAALGIGKPAVAYHKKKLGLMKPRIAGRMRKAKKKSEDAYIPPGESTDEATGQTFFPITDPDVIAQIWELVDEGFHTAGEISKRIGRVEVAVKAILMAPRP